MKDRVLTTLVGTYKETEWWGRNTAGFDPIGDMVLVLPDEAVTITTGGILMPDQVTDQNTMAAESGTLVALGEGAFRFTADGRPWVGPRPQVGDRVRMQRYSGQLQAGKDKHAYRLMTDRCIGAIEVASVDEIPAKEPSRTVMELVGSIKATAARVGGFDPDATLAAR